MKHKIEKNVIPAANYKADYIGGEDMNTVHGVAYKMSFLIVGGEFNGKKISRLVNPDSSGPTANISVFFAALAGLDPNDEPEVDDDDFIGCRYFISVVPHKEGYTKLGEIIRRVHVETKTANVADDDTGSADEETPF